MKYEGLSSKEARKRLSKYGLNILSEANKISALKILLSQVKGNFVVFLMLAGALISFFVGEVITFYVIILVISLVISLGFLQEYKAEKSITALKQMLMPLTVVVRDGKEKQLDSSLLVPGDIIILRTGEKVPADALVLEASDMQINEAVLTGEAHPVYKKGTKNSHSRKSENKVFMGTHILDGKCVAQVLHTGMNTEFGKIAGMIDSSEKDLPLQGKVNKIAKYMSVVAIVIAVSVGFLTIYRSPQVTTEVILETLVLVIAISVSAFPEGFPMVLISTLASGASRMAKKNAILNRMSIIETLGEVTVVCTDKTGTITKGEMTAKKLWFDNKLFTISGTGYNTHGSFLYQNSKVNIGRYAAFEFLAKACIVCNDSKIEKQGKDGDLKMIGMPTEAALLTMAAKANFYNEDLKFKRLSEISFNSQRKMMSVLCENRNEKFVFAKGAPEIILDKCTKIQKGNSVIKLSKDKVLEILDINQKLNDKRFRTLALAYRKPRTSKKTELEEKLVFLGIVALDDPPREEVKKTIAECKSAGIKVKMITGDNKDTAYEIGQEIGLNSGVLTGDEIEEMSDEELEKSVNQISVFARVKPEHKLRLVKAFKKNGEIVAMTGDGVNDAPAIKEAHVGIAMGKNGTDVSRETADLVLKDDNFATIVEAIREGRTIFNNIQKFVTFQLSCNVAELLIMFFAVLLGMPVPFVALQILFMNLVTDNLPAITLGFNPPSLDIMKTKARKNSDILNKHLVLQLTVSALSMSFITLIVYYFCYYVFGQELIIASTTALITLILVEIFNAFNFRSFRYPMQKLPLLTNKLLILASFISIVLTVLIVQTPAKHIFEVETLDLNNWLFAFMMAIFIVPVMDLVKRRFKDEIAQATNRKKALDI